MTSLGSFGGLIPQLGVLEGKREAAGFSRLSPRSYRVTSPAFHWTKQQSRPPKYKVKENGLYLFIRPVTNDHKRLDENIVVITGNTIHHLQFPNSFGKLNYCLSQTTESSRLGILPLGGNMGPTGFHLGLSWCIQAPRPWHWGALAQGTGG
jgi:hypothetical protein